MQSNIRRSKYIVSTFLVLLGAAAALPAQAAFNFTTIDYPGALNTQLWGISNVGKIVGYADFDNGATRGINFVYDPKAKTFTTLPSVPSAESTNAIAINRVGVVVGSAGKLDGTSNSGVMISKGAFTFFAHPGWPFTEGRGINDAGLVTGYATDFLVGPGVGFLYDPLTNTFTDFVPSLFTIAQGINRHNEVVGSAVFDVDGAYAGSSFGTFGFKRDAVGSITLFRVNGSDNNTYARGITGAGRIAGFFRDNNLGGKSRGFVGTLAGLSNHVLTIPDADVLDVPTSTDTTVEGEDDAGRIVGFWTDSSALLHGFLATPIPPKKK